MDIPIQTNEVTTNTDTNVTTEQTQTQTQTDVNVQDTTTQQQQDNVTNTDETDFSPLLKTLAEKAKYNGEPVNIESIDDVVTHYQKGMNYDKIHERYEALQKDPRLSFIDEIAKEYNMTSEEYIQAVKEQREQEEINQLIQNNIPAPLAQEIMESRKFREAQQQQQKYNAIAAEFVEVYPDKAVTDIPPSVWQEVKQGKASLVDAFTRYENQQLKEKVGKLEQSINVIDKNKQNADTSTGSLTGNGNVPSNFFSREQVEKMSQADVGKNYDAVIESMKHWK